MTPSSPEALAKAGRAGDAKKFADASLAVPGTPVFVVGLASSSLRSSGVAGFAVREARTSETATRCRNMKARSPRRRLAEIGRPRSEEHTSELQSHHDI